MLRRRTWGSRRPVEKYRDRRRAPDVGSSGESSMIASASAPPALGTTWAGTLGIGVITYNRVSTLTATLEAIDRLTTCDLEIVVADDGSTDGTREACAMWGVPCVSGPNRGPGINKNRALFWLLEETQADVILLLEEDAHPTATGWQWRFVEAALRWGHINWRRSMWEWFDERYRGEGTPARPYWSDCVTGQATASTRWALEAVGFLDTRLAGFGEEHVEWTHRFHKFFEWPRRTLSGWDCPVINAALADVDAGSYYDQAQTIRNQTIHAEISGEAIYRPPWRTNQERDELLAAITGAFASMDSGHAAELQISEQRRQLAAQHAATTGRPG